MELVEIFTAQHQQLSAICDRLQTDAVESAVAARAVPLRGLLDELIATLVAHLAMEDERLYPRLYRHQDSEIAELARHSFKELGDLRQRAGDLDNRWKRAEDIHAKPDDFAAEVTELCTALRRRIEVEESSLLRAVHR